jgi:hypothetical protein
MRFMVTMLYHGGGAAAAARPAEDGHVGGDDASTVADVGSVATPRVHHPAAASEAAAAAAAAGLPWCHTLVLQVHERNAAAIAFYKRHGFRVAGILRDYYCTGAVSNYGDGVQMERALRASPALTATTAAAVGGAVRSKAHKRNARRSRQRATGPLEATLRDVPGARGVGDDGAAP